MISVNLKPAVKKIIFPVVLAAGLGAGSCSVCADKKSDDKTIEYMCNNPKTQGTLAAFSLLGCLGGGRKRSETAFDKIKDIKYSMIEAMQYQEEKEKLLPLCDALEKEMDSLKENDAVSFVKGCINHIREFYSPNWASSDFGASIQWQDKNEEYVFSAMEKVLDRICDGEGDSVAGDSALKKRIENSKMIISNPDFRPFGD